MKKNVGQTQTHDIAAPAVWPKAVPVQPPLAHPQPAYSDQAYQAPAHPHLAYPAPLHPAPAYPHPAYPHPAYQHPAYPPWYPHPACPHPAYAHTPGYMEYIPGREHILQSEQRRLAQAHRDAVYERKLLDAKHQLEAQRREEDANERLQQMAQGYRFP